jgi:hypothetical protein
MTSLADITLSSGYAAASAAAEERVPAATLDSDHAAIRAWINATLIPFLDSIFRDDDTLRDEFVRLRNLHPEITALISAASDIAIKEVVACASTANLTLSGEQTIDGVLTAASRVLVKNQSTASQNGIYVTAAGAWTRATDADAAAELGLALVAVTGGESQAGTSWLQTVEADSITLGTTSLTWAQFSGRSLPTTVATIARLKALTVGSLPTGTAVQVLGYTSAGDGGGGLFRWNGADATADNGGTVIAPTSGSGRWNRVFTGAISAKWFGARFDGATDDTAAVEAANVLAATTGKVLHFSEGVCILSYLKLRSGVIYQGEGHGNTAGAIGTVLKLKSSTNADFITKATNGARGWVLRDLMIDGNKANQSAGSGILLHHSDDNVAMTGDTDLYGLITECWIANCKEDGLEVTGAGNTGDGNYYNVRNLIVERVQFRTCDGRGVNGSKLTDSKFAGCVVSGCKMGGYLFQDSSANVQVVNCKGYYNGADDATNTYGGMVVYNSKRMMIVNYEAQEEHVDGLKLFGADAVQIINYLADANGYPASANRTGLVIQESDNVLVSMIATSYLGATYLQNTGVRIVSTTTARKNIHVVLSAQHQTNNYTVSLSGGTLQDSSVTVNGVTHLYAGTGVVRYERGTDGEAVVSQKRFHSTNDAVVRTDLLPLAGSGAAQWDLFRETSTTGACEARVFRGDGAATVDHLLRTGGTAANRNAELCKNGGAWDTGHLTIGSYHLWIDSTGDLRIKSSAPTGDTDGTVVGTQT